MWDAIQIVNMFLAAVVLAAVAGCRYGQNKRHDAAFYGGAAAACMGVGVAGVLLIFIP